MIVRAYHFAFTGKDGRKASAVIDMIHMPYGTTVNQVTSNALAALIAAKGSNWLASYTMTEVK